VPAFAHVERGAERRRLALHRPRHQHREYPHVLARGLAETELGAVCVGAAALVLVHALQQMAAIVGVNQVDDRAADNVGHRLAAQIAEGLVGVAHHPVLHQEQRHGTQIGQAVGHSRAAVRHGSVGGGRGRNPEAEALRSEYMRLRLHTFWWSFGLSIAGFVFSVISVLIALFYGNRLLP